MNAFTFVQLGYVMIKDKRAIKFQRHICTLKLHCSRLKIWEKFSLNSTPSKLYKSLSTTGGSKILWNHWRQPFLQGDMYLTMPHYRRSCKKLCQLATIIDTKQHERIMHTTRNWCTLMKSTATVVCHLLIIEGIIYRHKLYISEKQRRPSLDPAEKKYGEKI